MKPLVFCKCVSMPKTCGRVYVDTTICRDSATFTCTCTHATHARTLKSKPQTIAGVIQGTNTALVAFADADAHTAAALGHAYRVEKRREVGVVVSGGGDHYSSFNGVSRSQLPLGGHHPEGLHDAQLKGMQAARQGRTNTNHVIESPRICSVRNKNSKTHNSPSNGYLVVSSYRVSMESTAIITGNLRHRRSSAST
jgi:hypothetical protein